MTYKPAYSVPEILRLRATGMTQREIAERFSISSSRVGQLIQASEMRARHDERANALRQELRASNDIGRKLPIEDVLCLLNLSGKARNRIQKWCEWAGITKLSLLDLMDMLLPTVEHPKDHYDLMPAYRVRGLGQKIYAEFIKAVTALECGPACEAEWESRKENLKAHLRDEGGFYPYILHGRGAALIG